MVKRILVIILLMITLICLTGCKTTDIYGNERSIEYGLIEINRISGNGHVKVVYDPNTCICYLVETGPYEYGISPYYIIGKDGKPEIAIYGVNYMVNFENN